MSCPALFRAVKRVNIGNSSLPAAEIIASASSFCPSLTNFLIIWSILRGFLEDFLLPCKASNSSEKLFRKMVNQHPKENSQGKA